MQGCSDDVSGTRAADRLVRLEDGCYGLVTVGHHSVVVAGDENSRGWPAEERLHASSSDYDRVRLTGDADDYLPEQLVLLHSHSASFDELQQREEGHDNLYTGSCLG